MDARFELCGLDVPVGTLPKNQRFTPLGIGRCTAPDPNDESHWTSTRHRARRKPSNPAKVGRSIVLSKSRSNWCQRNSGSAIAVLGPKEDDLEQKFLATFSGCDISCEQIRDEKEARSLRARITHSKAGSISGSSGRF